MGYKEHLPTISNVGRVLKPEETRRNKNKIINNNGNYGLGSRRSKMLKLKIKNLRIEINYQYYGRLTFVLDFFFNGNLT